MVTVMMHNKSDLTITDSIVWNPKLQLLEPQLTVSKIQNICALFLRDVGVQVNIYVFLLLLNLPCDVLPLSS